MTLNTPNGIDFTEINVGETSPRGYQVPTPPVVLSSSLLQVDEDEPLFLSLISDLFPGIQLDSASYEELQVAIQTQVDAVALVNHPAWNLKVVQVSHCSRVSDQPSCMEPQGCPGKPLFLSLWSTILHGTSRLSR